MLCSCTIIVIIITSVITFLWPTVLSSTSNHNDAIFCIVRLIILEKYELELSIL